ncbi:lantibiotic protection ABC transporter ATP-binding subunit [Ligilactobacillus sp. LYQ139]|uniref:lantibiotic protection ABC transporter ATP-binding subunit n=1 Tax=Ligilactobacillus sp. LYQ139 TaxID=3378800 RepID=UPI0038537187
MNFILTTKSLTKSYRNQQALNNVNIHIPENKIYCLLGPNGAGKTTLMKIITGMTSPTSGDVEFNHHKWTRKDLSNIGSLIEEAPIYGNLTARENIQVINRLRGESDSNIEKILSTVGLEDSKKLSKNFSLGMKERLGIALALVGDPQLLILDEPTNGLDPIGIQELRNLIVKLKSKGITIIIASHMLSEIEKLADYIGIISDGRLLLEEEYTLNTDLEKLFNKTIADGRKGND